LREKFPTGYAPTIFDNKIAKVSNDKTIISLELWDKGG